MRKRVSPFWTWYCLATPAGMGDAAAGAGVRVITGAATTGLTGAGAAEMPAIGSDAGTASGAARGSTGTNFGCDKPAGMDTYDGSGGTALAGTALPGARSVTPGSIGTFLSSFLWLAQPPAVKPAVNTHAIDRAVAVCLVTRNLLAPRAERWVRERPDRIRASMGCIGIRRGGR